MQIHDSFKPFFNKNQIKKEIDNIFSNIGLAIHKDSYLDIKYESKLDKYYFPCYEDVFRLASLDLNKAKYIILGMDPYPSYYIEDNIKKNVENIKLENSNVKLKTFDHYNRRLKCLININLKHYKYM